MKKLLAAVGLAVALTVGAFTAQADNSWNGFHWDSASLAPTVQDTTDSPLYDVPAAVAEWDALSTPIQPVLTNGKGVVKVSEGFSPFWLGQARIFVEGGHITKGEVKLNTQLLNSYGAAAADHVLCQELGHVLGLAHQIADSCMNDTLGTLGLYITPNAHDAAQLTLIYNHVDATVDEPDDGGRGGPPCSKRPDHPNCRAGAGVWITVHEVPVP